MSGDRPGPPADLSVVVVSFNTRAALERTLAAAFADLDGLAAEVVVVDNGSADGSAAAARERFPEARVVENRENRFYTAANNQGFALARGRYLLVLNSDAVVGRGTFPAVVRAMDARPGVGIASCRLTWADGRVQRNASTERSYLALLLEHTLLGLLLAPLRDRLRAREWYADWDRESEREVGVLPGSFLLVRREVLEAVGGFDERLRLYFAEDEWCARIRGSGRGVRYLPVGAVVHPEGATVRQAPGAARRIYFEDLGAYVEGRFGKGRARLLRALSRPLRLGLDLAGRLRGEGS